MITQKERELGSRFALINIVATIASFVILAFVIGPDQTGYDESLGPITNLIGLAQGLSFLGIVRLSGKLFNSDENPLLAGAVAVAYGTAVVGLMFTLTPTFIANGFTREL
jgi:drug/metabolite transporter (DMT)-like permease